MGLKKILHVYSSWTAGGAEKVMLSIVNELQKRGIDNAIACPQDSYLFERAKALGIKVYPVAIKGSFDPVGFIKLWNTVNKEKADIIHAHQGKVFWPCIFVKWLKGSRLKVVFHRHADIPHKWYSRSHYRWADKVIAISEAVKDNLIINENIPENKVRVIYNGLDFKVFNSNVSGMEVRKKYGLENKVVIGNIGAMNLPKGKGQQYLIEAAKVLRDKYPDVYYLVLGDGPFKKTLIELTDESGLHDKIIFAGYQENIQDFIAVMDIFCLLSWDKEGLGQVMIEAQAMGKPVIGTNVGGIPETFDSGKTGYLVPKEDSKELVRVLEILLSDEAKRKKMGADASNSVKEKFSIDSTINNIIEVYKSL
ncbi:MAG: glycosyltransferase family 4 protein [Elusimicrobia bacterium]|nr:glycosyltransferase family 4 protein [Candidatus Liberimonas magnetica]